MKSCIKCNAVKPLDDFYKHPRMADGHLNMCKECAKRIAIDNRLKNIDRVRAYDSERAKRKERSRMSVEVNRKWRAADRRRVACHNAVSRAIKAGVLKQYPCERCGSVKSVAH